MIKPSMMKGFVAGILGMLMFFSSMDSAQAYSVETHFYETEVMLLMAGVHPAFSERIASYAQGVDTSLLNSAMNPIPLVHAHVSRLMHFPTEGASPLSILIDKFKVNSTAEAGSHGSIQNIFSVARRNSMIANELFNEALKTGSPFLMGAALHVLMDSYAHEGFNYIVGHGERGHYPDRPWMFVEKHNEMRQLLFKAMTRIREVLPAEALSDIRVNSLGKLNREMTAEELYQEYSNNPLIKEATASNPHRDPLYTGEAAAIILDTLEKSGTAKPGLRNYVFQNLQHLFFEPMADGLPRDGWAVVQGIVDHLYDLPLEERARLLDIDKALLHYGNVSQEVSLKGKNGQIVKVLSSDVTSQVQLEQLKSNMVIEICQRVIPKPALGDQTNEEGSKATFENEQLNKKVEEPMQRAKWQNVRLKVFKLAPVELSEAKLFSKIFMFLKHDVLRLAKQLDSMEAGVTLKVEPTMREKTAFMFRLFKYTILDFVSYRVTTPLVKLGLLKKPLGNLRLVDEDVRDAKFWQIDPIFNKLKDAGVYKMLYSSEAATEIISNWEKHNRDFAATLQALLDGKLADPLQRMSQRKGEFFKEQASANHGVAIRQCSVIYAR
jgi:hypothetical protein